jgi:hypothetical protein
MGLENARRALGKLETAAVNVRYGLHPREVARELSMLKKVSRADEDKARKVATGARIGRQPDVVLPEQIRAEIPCLLAHLPHGPEQIFRI